MKNVLWTGGWDSTYRVLDLLINQQETVQPFYLLDGERTSTQIELQTIQTVRDQLEAKFPDALKRLQPLQTCPSHEVQKNQEITAASNAIRAKTVMGTQYDWIARFVKQQQSGRVELSIHRDDKARNVVADYVQHEDATIHIDDRFTGTPGHRDTRTYALSVVRFSFIR